MRKSLLLLTACAGVLIFAAPTALLATLLLLPTALAWAGDTSDQRGGSSAVLLFGLAAAMPSLIALWNSGHELADAAALGLDLRTLARCWAAQACGWLIGELVPTMLTASLKTQASRRQLSLTQQRDQIESEWH